ERCNLFGVFAHHGLETRERHPPLRVHAQCGIGSTGVAGPEGGGVVPNRRFGGARRANPGAASHAERQRQRQACRSSDAKACRRAGHAQGLSTGRAAGEWRMTGPVGHFLHGIRIEVSARGRYCGGMGITKPEPVAILRLRNAVLFPMSVVPINVARPRSVRLVEELAGRERALVGVVSQRTADTVEPTFDDVHSIGTLARVVKVIRLGQANYSVVLNGLTRFRIESGLGLEPYMKAEVRRIKEVRADDPEVRHLATELKDSMRQVLELMPDLPKETAAILDNVHEPGALADLIASNFSEDQAGIEERQQILEALDSKARVRRVLAIVKRQLAVLRKKDAIAEEIRDEIATSQREYVVREQTRTILEELGDAGEQDEVDELRTRVLRAELPKEAADAARKQLSRLRAMQSQSAEYNVARNYVEWLADLPW